MKLKDRFILTSKEDIQRNARMRRTLTLAVLFSSVVIPLLNDGVLYTLVEYTASDIAVLPLNYILRYTVVLQRYICVFVSFSAVITGIFHYGYKEFKTPSVILIAGSIIKYLAAQFGSWIFCYEHGLIAVDVTDAAAAGFDYFFLAVFDMIKNIVLIIICCRFAKKARDHGLPDSSSRPDKIRLLPLLRKSVSGSNPFLRFCLFAAGVQAGYEILSNFFSVTIYQLITDGLPETGLDYASLLSGYALIIPLCAAGFFICVTLCVAFSYLKPAKRQ